MKLETGKTLPDVTFLQTTEAGLQRIALKDLTKDKTVVLFALPGAYTGTCSTAHMPSFVRNADRLRAEGVDHIACISVNDPAVMNAWGEDTGAHDAGILMLADADGSYTKAVEMAYDAPASGLYGRCKRHSLLVKNGVIQAVNVEVERGVCDISGAETILDQLAA
jgi:cytochrome c peroxidase